MEGNICKETKQYFEGSVSFLKERLNYIVNLNPRIGSIIFYLVTLIGMTIFHWHMA